MTKTSLDALSRPLASPLRTWAELLLISSLVSLLILHEVLRARDAPPERLRNTLVAIVPLTLAFVLVAAARLADVVG